MIVLPASETIFVFYVGGLWTFSLYLVANLLIVAMATQIPSSEFLFS